MKDFIKKIEERDKAVFDFFEGMIRGGEEEAKEIQRKCSSYKEDCPPNCRDCKL